MIPICRLFGISYGSEPEDMPANEMAAILYSALIHQGPHAWGWMSYDGSEIVSHKQPGRATDSSSVDIQLEMIDPKPLWLVGHLRFATHGKPEHNVNNHPIPHGNIIGVHNGVLRNHEDIIAKTGRQDPAAIVDSEAIFAAVNKWGPKKGLAKIRGDMVAIYADQRKPLHVFIARTHGRQVTIGWTDKGNIIFASEEQALRVLEPEVRFIKFSTVSENRLLDICAGKIVHRTTFREVERKPLYVPPPASRTLEHRAPRTTSWTQWDAVEANREARAAHRGEILFPKGSKKKGRRGRMVPREEEALELTSDLHYFRGELMTTAEYHDALERAMDE